METLIVEFSLDPETKGWTATMPAVPAVVTQGKTLKEAHARVRSALSLVYDEWETVPLRGRALWDTPLDLSKDALNVVKKEAELRIRALDIAAELERATVHAVGVLIHEEQLTYRSTGSLLGITHQRVEQIAKAEQAEDI